MEMAHRVQFGFIIKMWTLLDYDGKTVVEGFAPNTPQNEMEKIAKGRIIIKMTPENSPAWIGAKYVNGKFI